MILGVVLAGGRSRRFGSDKALAKLNGRTLLDLAVRRLDDWCDTVVVAGRVEAPATTVPDWPRPGRGPLGGLAGALRHATRHGFDDVLSIGVDSLGLPDDLPALLAPAPSCLANQPVIGLWPAGAAAVIAEILEGDGSHAMLALADALGARKIELANPPANINSPADLAAFGP
jgi:molybdopterin-guanine dinucleotide biosynthesis protein A